MKSGTTRCFEHIEDRLQLLRKLIRTEEEWRGAFVRLNLHDSERCSADAELICEAIRILDKEISSWQASSSKSLEPDPVTDQRIRIALGQMAVLHLELKRTNEINMAILHRSKVTINALRNLFNSLAPTYAAPAAHSVGTIYEENV